MRETVDTIASPQTNADAAMPRGVGAHDSSADGTDFHRFGTVGCDLSHRSGAGGMTALAAIEGANPSTGAAVDGVGTLLSWDSPRARFDGDGTASGVTEVLSHASLPEGDALAWYSPLGDGSTRGVYGAAGEVLAMVGYSPYGAPSTHNAGAAPAFSYTGKPYDAATGLYHFPYRQYDPQASRWLTRDPLGMVDGPNVYAYVMGNPVGAVDPLGLKIGPLDDLVACVYEGGQINEEKLREILKCLEPDRCNSCYDNCATGCVCLVQICGDYLQYMACYAGCTAGCDKRAAS